MNDDPRLGLPSASSFGLDFICAGRQNLLRAMREQGLTEPEEPGLAESAARGTRIHEARKTGSTFQLQDAGEIEAYQRACELENSLTEQWMTDYEITSVGDPINSERLWFVHPLTLEPLLSGELDVAFLAGPNALIHDWKSGAAYYAGSAVKSWQLRIYALLLKKELTYLRNIRVTFVKPETFGPKTDVANFDEYNLEQIERAVLLAVWKSQQPDAALTAGAHCRLCPARGVCREAARFSLMPTTLFLSANGPSDISALVSTMTPEAALEVWRKRGIIRVIMEAITQRLDALPDDEVDRLGLKRTKGRKVDEMRDPVGAFNALRAAGYSTEQIFRCMEFNKGRLVEMFQMQTMCRDVEAEAWHDSLMEPFVERRRGKPSLVEK